MEFLTASGGFSLCSWISLHTKSVHKVKNGVVWFVGKDVASVLGYERGTKAVADHVDDENRFMVDAKTQSKFGIELGQRGGWLINESGLYSLILSSKLAERIVLSGQKRQFSSFGFSLCSLSAKNEISSWFALASIDNGKVISPLFLRC